MAVMNLVREHTTQYVLYPGVPVGGSHSRVFQATVVGTGALVSNNSIQYSNDNANWAALGTINLSGTDRVTGSLVSVEPWHYIRVVINELTGTGATVRVNVSFSTDDS